MRGIAAITCFLGEQPAIYTTFERSATGFTGHRMTRRGWLQPSIPKQSRFAGSPPRQSSGTRATAAHLS
jgi:hypothetical protein